MRLPLRLVPAIKADRLLVTVENTSPDHVRIWSRRCSWGYSTFSLILARSARPDDRHELTTKPILWTVNPRRLIEIEAGGGAVVTFLPSDPEWLGLASFEPWRGESWQVRVRLCIPDTSEARVCDVLTGELTSPPVISEPLHAWLFGPQGSQ